MAHTDEKRQSKIWWLASYPKSGNTWTRILLSHLVGSASEDKSDGFVHLSGSISSNRVKFDHLTGLQSSDLTDDEIDLLRAATYRATANDSEQDLYVKVHDAYHDDGDGKPIFPADCSSGIIYLVRNPLDVAISYAYHQGHEDFGRVVKQLNAADHVMAGGPKSQLRQKTLGWTGHFRSWHEQTDIPILTIRYEDMIADTAACVTRMAKFLNLDDTCLENRVAAAVDASRFDRLQKQEDDVGFRERPQKANRFFRSGRTGEGSEKLPEKLQSRLIEANYDLMKELGYLEERA